MPLFLEMTLRVKTASFMKKKRTKTELKKKESKVEE
jgi:hypothetical protein